MISVVLPTKNRAVYLPDAINSIIKQTYKDWELIIVDNGSTDSSKYIYDYFTAKNDRIKVIYVADRGISYARNQGVKAAKGEYIAVMDSDDICSPERLKLSLKKIKNADFVYSAYYMADPSGNVQQTYLPPKKISFENIKKNDSWPHVTIMAKRECFVENPYRDDFKVNDDAWLVYTWFKAGYKAKGISDPLVIVRYHNKSVSKSRADEVAKTQEIMDNEYRKNES